MTADSIKILRSLLILFVAFFPGLLGAPAQQPQPAVPSPSTPIKLTVVVDSKTGQPVANLTQQDFTILDNKSRRPITSFRVMTPAQEPVEVILLIDAVNTPYEMVAYMRNGAEKFLKKSEGALAHPTTIAVLTDNGIQIENGFSTDGNALNDTLKKHEIGLREIMRESQWSGIDRLTISVRALHQLVAYASTLPGRKVILFVSPGWPLFSGPDIYLDYETEQQIFGDVVSFSGELRQAGITLYNINPIGAGQPMLQAEYYKVFLNGVTKPSNAQFGNLGIQVLAIQSGGLTFESNSDVSGNIQKCLADVQSWYEIAFDPLPADQPNKYHQIQIKFDKPGFIARTRTGYYSNPQIIEPHR